MNTTQYNARLSKVIGKAMELTTMGATFAEWHNVGVELVEGLDGISNTRLAHLRRVYREMYVANMHQNTAQTRMYNGVLYVNLKPTNRADNTLVINGKTYKSTVDLHDSHTLNNKDWDDMKLNMINRISGVLMQ